MNLKYILNNKLVDQNSALVHVHDLGLLRGYGVFDFFRLVGQTPLFFDDHIDRFYRSAEFLHLTPPLSKPELKNLIIEMLSSNQIDNSGVRMVLTGGESPNGYSIGTPTLFVINEPISPPNEEHFTKGIKLISLEYKRDLPEIKSTNYLVGIYNFPKAKQAGASDILYHFNLEISELTRSNFFIIDDKDTIITADQGILLGINRKNVLKMCEGKYKIEERTLMFEELKTAREAFMTGTTKKITPVVQIDDIVIGNGKPGTLTKKLQVMYDQVITDYLEAQ